MAIFDGLRYWFFKRFLKSKMQRLPHVPISVNTARTVGVLFTADNNIISETVMLYAQKLKEQGKEVQLLGYLTKRDHSRDYLFPYITRKDTNWFRKPGGGTVGFFIKNRFDLLINFADSECLPLEYIAALSHARFRVGFNEKGILEYYDCILLAQPGATIENLTENLEKYLS